LLLNLPGVRIPGWLLRGGVTGTNGKTTIITLLRNIFLAAELHGGTIGTFGYSIDGNLFPTLLTTPDSKELHRYFHDMIQQDVTIVAMEVSSHALALNRTDDISFNTGIFTNIGRDHLDFHKTRETYRDEKGKLFRSLTSSGCAILNRDSSDYSWFAEQTEAPVLSYALESEHADFFYTRYHSDFSGCSGTVRTPDGSLEIKSQLPGRYNMANILAAIAAARHHKISEEAIQEGVAQTAVEGRMEIVPAPYSAPNIFVDYAHTPDALESVLKELQWINRHEIDRKIILVFGCGGNRDKEKRPEMGSIAEQYADEIIITNDNPRDEDPLRIIEEINEGISRADVIIEPDRRKAIYTAIELADPKDVVLIAGKGHETNQTIQGKQFPFDDKEVAAEAVKEILAQ